MTPVWYRHHLFLIILYSFVYWNKNKNSPNNFIRCKAAAIDCRWTTHHHHLANLESKPTSTFGQQQMAEQIFSGFLTKSNIRHNRNDRLSKRKSQNENDDRVVVRPCRPMDQMNGQREWMRFIPITSPFGGVVSPLATKEKTREIKRHYRLNNICSMLLCYLW